MNSFIDDISLCKSLLIEDQGKTCDKKCWEMLQTRKIGGSNGDESKVFLWFFSNNVFLNNTR